MNKSLIYFYIIFIALSCKREATQETALETQERFQIQDLNKLHRLVDSLRKDSVFNNNYLILKSFTPSAAFIPPLPPTVATKMKNGYKTELTRLRSATTPLTLNPGEVFVSFNWMQFKKTIVDSLSKVVNSSNVKIFDDLSKFELRIYNGFYVDDPDVRKYMNDLLPSSCDDIYLKHNTSMVVIAYNGQRIQTATHLFPGTTNKIHTYFNLGGLCPPGCPDVGIVCIDALNEPLD